MCGIGGFLRTGPESDAMSQELLQSMGDAIVHRGPDMGDQWQDNAIGLVHRRLSILDLSSAGAQPMHSASGRYVMVYNGEIYNFRALRLEMEQDGVQFATQTDSEVLLALYERDGAECLSRLNGMFALAIWDRQEQSLFLARDRLGKKPLYVFQHGERLAFASEIKALLPLPFVDRQVRDDAVQDFFFYQYVPDPKTIFKHIHKLPPAHWMKIQGSHREQHCWWQLSFKVDHHRSEANFQEALLNTLEDSVRLRLVSDAPLGAFLSGGIDSSAVVGLMARHTSAPVTTCTIGFADEAFDEVEHARRVSGQFKTDHHEFTAADNVADHLMKIARYFDEPFADPSFVPTYFVCELARRKVKVALAGDGGDESFAGYQKYVTELTEQKLRRLLPAGVRQPLLSPLAGVMQKIPGRLSRRGGSLFDAMSRSSGRGFAMTNGFFDQRLWRWLIRDDFARSLAGYDSAEITEFHYRQADGEDHLAKVLYTDIKTWLPGDILTKVDRMSMAHSLETRAPFLDYRLVELAASMPSRFKLHKGEKKVILKKALQPLLTDETLYRRKQGFSVPLANWLRGPLRPLVERKLLVPGSGVGKWFRQDRLESLWRQHLGGDDRYASELWSLLMFELWWQAYGVETTSVNSPLGRPMPPRMATVTVRKGVGTR